MPIFTVTVKDDKTGNTKTVTVNTDGMIATVIPSSSIISEEPVVESTEPVVESTEPVVESTEPAVESNGDKSKNKSKGGKRYASSFRLKKRRITRKLKKTQ